MFSGLGFPGSDKLDLSEWILIDQHTFGGSAPGADGAGQYSRCELNDSYRILNFKEIILEF